MLKKVFLSLLLLISLASFNTAYASQDITLNRLAGNDRYETACQIAKAGWTQADYAILAYGQNYPDALAVVPFAYKLNAPVLLTEKDSLNAKTKAILQELKVKTVYIIGGLNVISANQEKQLTDLGYMVKRISGQDRYETSVKIAAEFGNVSKITVASGEDYADALSMAPIAAQMQIPVILVPKDDLTGSIQNYLSTHKITQTYVVWDDNNDLTNNTAKVINTFNNPSILTGKDKYARNVTILESFKDSYQSAKIFIATGENFADALTGAVYAAKNNGAIVLVKKDLPAETKSFLQTLSPSVSTVTIFGGEGAVPLADFQSFLNINGSLDLTNGNSTLTNDKSGMGIEILQNGKSYSINNLKEEINLEKGAFTMRFNLLKKAQGIHIASLEDESTFNEEITNISLDDAQYFNPGASYAGYLDKPYDSMVISNQGQHYIFYESNDSRRADLVAGKDDYYRLEWKIETITLIPSDIHETKPEYDIKDAPLNKLYLVLFTDNNLNNIIDSGEFVKIKVNLT